MNNTQFYNAFAEEYNAMIPLDQQVETKQNFYKKLVDLDYKTAADLGAGSGADSIALAKLKLEVTAFEPSAEMVNQAKRNFEKLNTRVDIYNKKIAEIDESFHNRFDLVVSMGNTFANINRNEIEASVKKMVDLIKPGGKAVIQILNYDKVLKDKERIVNITESSSKQFIRFYDFCSEKVYFNILSFQKDDFSKRDLITTEIFPYTKIFLEKQLVKNSIDKMEFYGDMKLNEFVESESANLIIIINKD